MPEPSDRPVDSTAHSEDRTLHGHGHGEPRVDDSVVPWRIFLVIGVLIAVLAGIYWFTAYEDAGTVMLVLSAVLALWFGAFLWLQWHHLRQPHVAATHVAAGPKQPVEEEYMPHASVWPFVIGLGGATAGNGLVLGTWVLVPGVFLTLVGIAGFVRQTRNRD